MSIRRSQVPVEWIRACRAGRSAKWIAQEFNVPDWRTVHRALMGCGAYQV